MVLRRLSPLVFGLAFLLFLSPGRGAEKWADPRLSVVEGLELWLDAGRVNDARASQGQAALKSGSLLETWFDASGHGRHVRQPNKACQPRLLQVGADQVVRFDGEDDHLRCTGLDRTLDACTVFLVAAPHANPGDFRGFLAINQTGKRDYETGFTIDQSAGATGQFSQLNVEGRGFGGARNLLKSASPFGTLHLIETVVDPKKKTVAVILDGKPAGSRPFAPASLRLNEITIGARYYTNGPGAQQVRGFLEGDIAEVLLYNRVLSDTETRAVRRYLETRYARLKEDLPARLKLARGGEPLVSVTDPPPVQMFLPGFTVKELPVDLTNINNVRYRPDGKLLALAYDGNVYLLSDSDGDGLEDKVELFWENKGRLRSPIGMALTPPKYKHGDGLFVASKGKCSLIVDTDGDGKADKEIILAQGWKELPHGVDALGVAYDPRDGSVYFGLGTADFVNAYLTDKDGRGHYDLKSERGTVLRIAPDFRSRSIYCTGIRFSVALSFNREGDLFATDQEGATWLPNGNPFDELLHLEKGRHYGFPPRHPKHLPDVIDEPSVFDYGPQHQSTCGLFFNEPVNAGPVFGPPWWRGNALVTGYSRGKLYRTELVKTKAGYVARNQLLACLNKLAVDVCVSPKGELVVATHSGGPDWGSGPGGKGKLYKIFFDDKTHPQPVGVWPASPGEVHVAFDRPLDPRLLEKLASRTKITYGRYVRAGDRFESLRPGYAVVQRELATPRFDLPILRAQVTSDRRTLILSTPAQREPVHYALTLPRFGIDNKPDAPAREHKPDAPARGPLPQHPQIDLDYTLTGVAATWEPKGAGGSWSGWLPHLDLAVAKAFTAGSAAHDRLWQSLKGPGTLTLRTRLNLTDLLRPAVQPGSTLDHTWPAEKATLVFSASGSLTVNGREQTRLTLSPKPNDPVPVEVVLSVADGVPFLGLSYHTAEDDRPRALPLHRFLLPWVESSRQSTPLVERRIPELEGGSWARGRQVFFSEEAACSKCHAVRGEGGSIGPDLSNLIHRDYQSVLRDIADPSFAINPDYVTYVVTLKDGRVLVGAVRTEGDKLLIGDTQGRVSTVPRDGVETLEATGKSIMPEGMPKALGAERMKHLLTFLLTDPPRMPEYGREKPPPPRTRAEVRAVLAGAPDPPAKTRPLHIVLVAGRKDHGPGEHDYPAWQKVWKELLSAAKDTRVTTAWDWPQPEDLKSADVLVFYQQGKWTPERARAIDAYLARGGGLVYIHYAVDGGADAPGFAQRIGLAWRGGQSKFRHGPLELGFETGTKHPIGRNFGKVKMVDESYWQLAGDPKRVQLLATAVEDGRAQPLFWTLEPSKGRVFVSIPGHYAWTFDDPLFRILLLRGIAWSAKEPVDRFNDQVLPGARVTD
jgi:putative heme-binding domain-containing protein